MQICTLLFRASLLYLSTINCREVHYCEVQISVLYCKDLHYSKVQISTIHSRKVQQCRKLFIALSPQLLPPYRSRRWDPPSPHPLIFLGLPPFNLKVPISLKTSQPQYPQNLPSLYIPRNFLDSYPQKLQRLYIPSICKAKNIILTFKYRRNTSKTKHIKSQKKTRWGRQL